MSFAAKGFRTKKVVKFNVELKTEGVDKIITVLIFKINPAEGPLDPWLVKNIAALVHEHYPDYTMIGVLEGMHRSGNTPNECKHCTLKPLKHTGQRLVAPNLIHLYTQNEGEHLLKGTWFKQGGHTSNLPWLKRLATDQTTPTVLTIDLSNSVLSFEEISQPKEEALGSGWELE